MAPEGLSGLPAVASWLRHAEPTRTRVEAAAAGSGDKDAIRANVQVQLDHLRSYPFVFEREARGELSLHGWVYALERGEVLELDAGGRFMPAFDTSARAG